MARRIFFSFHYDEDIWRVSQVRNSGITREAELNHPVDNASWESLKRQGDEAVKRWINSQLSGVGVTAVLIGAYTASRPYVQYEVQRSSELGKGLLGIRIHNLKNKDGRTSWAGTNPLDSAFAELPLWPGSTTTTKKPLSQIFRTYDWVNDNGYENFAAWADEAARIAGR